MKYKLCLWLAVLVCMSVLLTACSAGQTAAEMTTSTQTTDAAETRADADKADAAAIAEEADAPGELTEEQLDWFQTSFFQTTGENGEMFGWNPNTSMLTSEYETAGQVDLFRLFYNGCEPGENPEVSDEERTALTEIDAEAERLDITKLTRAQMDEALTHLTGLTLDETAQVGLEQFVYLADYDAYYLVHGDFIDSRCTVLSGEREADGTVQLRYELEDGAQTGVVTLQATQEGYLFVANRYDK